jgi:hypothetical protein
MTPVRINIRRFIDPPVTRGAAAGYEPNPQLADGLGTICLLRMVGIIPSPDNDPGLKEEWSHE